MKKISSVLLLLILLSNNVFAFKTINEIATKVGGYDIPIKIALPEKSTGKMPVMFFVHGGGWNGGDGNNVPDAEIPADCDLLCDQMGIIYVGLAYRCKGNNGTFHLALHDLEASIKWFVERADQFNADTSRIGFSGASAGTTLSAVLAQRTPNCKVYNGREGMYNVLDMDSTLSNFPDTKSRTDFGLISQDQKLEASPFYHIRKKPAMSLLLHGKDDWLCHYTQSVEYAEQIKKEGGKCKLVLYNGINHTCLNFAYPEVFKNSLMEIARLMAKGFQLKNTDYETIETNVDNRLRLLYSYENVPGSKLVGSWESSMYGTFTFQENGKGHFLENKAKQTKYLTYQLIGSWFSVKVEDEEIERVFYLRKNDHTIYELITGDIRFKGRRNEYRKM